jgi:drug/metabolite transporter (DMT)-like permease
MKFVDLNKKSWQWIVLLALAFIWGSSFILMKKGLRSFDYMQVAALRVFFSFIILSPVFLKNIRKVNRKNVLHLIISC